MPKRALALVTAAALSVIADQALAATSFSVTVSPATRGTATALQPVKVAIRTSITAAGAAPAPPAIRKLTIELPDGFTTTLPSIASCIAPDFAAKGSAACPAASRLGAGSASFAYVSGPVRIAASTEELVLFHGPREQTKSTLHLYLRIAKPVALSLAIPGTIEDRPAPRGPLVVFDLTKVAEPDDQSRISVTKAAFDLERGLVGGPCPRGTWTFAARLEYATGAVDERRADAACSSTPDTTAPSLRVTARDQRATKGARLALRLSEPARVRIALERRSPQGRWVAVRRTTIDAGKGPSAVRIRRLKPGRYRARLRATDAAGNASRRHTVTFRLR